MTFTIHLSPVAGGATLSTVHGTAISTYQCPPTCETAAFHSAPGTIRLSEARVGLDYTVTRIPDEDYPLLRYLVKNEILPGQRLSVEDIAGYRGVVDLRRNGNQVALGMDGAARIRVMPVA